MGGYMTAEQAVTLKILAQAWAVAAHDLALSDLASNFLRHQQKLEDTKKAFCTYVDSLVEEGNAV
jgi:hypothetical protein